MKEFIKQLEKKVVSFPYPTIFDVHDYVKLTDVKKLYEAINCTHSCKSDSEPLQAVEDLKEFARNNCRKWNVEEL